jgi:hypothetical protein
MGVARLLFAVLSDAVGLVRQQERQFEAKVQTSIVWLRRWPHGQRQPPTDDEA